MADGEARGAAGHEHQREGERAARDLAVAVAAQNPTQGVRVRGHARLVTEGERWERGEVRFVHAQYKRGGAKNA
jgi:hypothetical protein